MTNEIREAIPTEYDGTLFRSKSEAIFARALDLRGFKQWEYEPRRIFTSNDNWCPDFWLVFKNTKKRIFSATIEYKPSDPTDTYLGMARRRAGELCEFSNDHCLFLVVIGSSFNAERKTLALTPNGWTDIEKGIGLLRFIDEASKYRFDLKGGGQ